MVAAAKDRRGLEFTPREQHVDDQQRRYAANGLVFAGRQRRKLDKLGHVQLL
jgi:hypothetical protein